MNASSVIAAVHCTTVMVAASALATITYIYRPIRRTPKVIAISLGASILGAELYTPEVNVPRVLVRKLTAISIIVAG